MGEPAAPPYQLTTLWRFDAPLDAVWHAIADADSWPTWWRGVDSVLLERGDAGGVGARRRYICRSVLPLRFTFVARVTRVIPMQLIEGQVEGELEGIGCCRLACADGLTTVRHDWQVRTTRRWMNWLAPLARHVFRWNHDQLMRAGGIGLARHLNAHPGAGVQRTS